MKEDENFYIWNKKDPSEWIGKYFKTSEFTCKCDFDDCIQQCVSKDLINRLEWLRGACNSPLRIHSGYRCSKYQQKIRDSGVSTVVAKNKSTHELGEAADVSCSALVPGELMKLAEHVFTSIGTAINFLHLDTRPGVRRWKY